MLKNIDFPASKSQILDFVKDKGNNEILSKIQLIEEKKYMNVSDIAKAAGIVS